MKTLTEMADEFTRVIIEDKKRQEEAFLARFILDTGLRPDEVEYQIHRLDSGSELWKLVPKKSDLKHLIRENIYEAKINISGVEIK